VYLANDQHLILFLTEDWCAITSTHAVSQREPEPTICQANTVLRSTDKSTESWHNVVDPSFGHP
jgi:hypothetical protein